MGTLKLIGLLFFSALPQTLLAQPAPVDVKIISAPWFVNIDGWPAAYYELHLTNTQPDTLTLQQVDVQATDVLIASFDKTALQQRLTIHNKPIRDNKLPPAQSVVLYIEIKLNVPLDKLIAHLHHQITVTGKNNQPISIKGARHTLKPIDPRLVLGPPLKSGLWTAVYEPSWERGHRRVLYTVDGKERIPGRYAIDFIMVNEEGKYVNGDENITGNWLGYGSEVLAVSDGIVASVRTDFPESHTLSEHPKVSAENATGNYISIDIGNNYFVFYEHLKPGSIRVKPGQKVKKGDVIAALGFTGQTTGPHLHFHVADANSPLGAEGIPFVFENFKLLGVYRNIEKLGKEVWSPANRTGQRIGKERPAPNEVISF